MNFGALLQVLPKITGTNMLNEVHMHHYYPSHRRMPGRADSRHISRHGIPSHSVLKDKPMRCCKIIFVLNISSEYLTCPPKLCLRQISGSAYLKCRRGGGALRDPAQVHVKNDLWDAHNSIIATMGSKLNGGGLFRLPRLRRLAEGRGSSGRVAIRHVEQLEQTDRDELPSY